MDKAKFVASAPNYYALAVIDYMIQNPIPATKNEIFGKYFIDTSEHEDDGYFLLHDGRLFDIAIEILTTNNLVSVDIDDFGPPIIIPSENFSEKFQNYCNLQPKTSLFNKYIRFLYSSKSSWLIDALKNVLNTEHKLDIQDSDYDNLHDEWSPIPVELEKPETQAVIAAVDDAIEKIRSDNGYTATQTEERDYVVDGLTTFRKRLKEAATISVPYVRQYAIEPLFRAGKSLGKSLAGLAIEALKSKIKDWMMKQGIPWPLDWQ